jgi:hypothetical protein
MSIVQVEKQGTTVSVTFNLQTPQQAKELTELIAGQLREGELHLRIGAKSNLVIGVPQSSSVSGDRPLSTPLAVQERLSLAVQERLSDDACQSGVKGFAQIFGGKLRYQVRPNRLHHCPYFVRYCFEDGRFNHVARDRLRFGRH